MTADRPYRKGMSFDAARGEIIRMSGRQFDPEAVRAFLAEEATLREMVVLKCETAAVDDIFAPPGKAKTSWTG